MYTFAIFANLSFFLLGCVTHPHSTDFNIWLNTTKLWLPALFDLNSFFLLPLVFSNLFLQRWFSHCVKFWIWPQWSAAVPQHPNAPIRAGSLPSRALRRRGGFLVLLAVHSSGGGGDGPGNFGKVTTILFFSLSQRTRNKRVYENWKYGRDRIAGWGARQSPLLFFYYFKLEHI